MSCHGFAAALKAYYEYSSGITKISFKEWAKDNVSISDKNKILIDQKMKDWTMFTTDQVGDLYDQYSSTSAMQSGDGFAAFVADELSLPAENAEAFLGIGRKKSYAEKAIEDKLKRDKEAAKKVVDQEKKIEKKKLEAEKEIAKQELERIKDARKREEEAQKELAKIKRQQEEEKAKLAALQTAASCELDTTDMEPAELRNPFSKKPKSATELALEQEKKKLAELQKAGKKEDKARRELEKVKAKQEEETKKQLEGKIVAKQLSEEERKAAQEKIKHLESKLEGNASAGQALFKKKEKGVLEWTDQDAYSVYQALLSPDKVTGKQATTINKIIKHLTVKNNYVKSLMNGIKNNGAVTTEMVCKMLSVLKDRTGADVMDMPPSRYVGTGENMMASEDFTVADYYDIHLAFTATCKGPLHAELTKPTAKDEKTSAGTVIKKAIGFGSQKTFEWDDSVAEALKSRLTETVKTVDIEMNSKLKKLVREICNNKAIKEIDRLAREYVSAHGPPVTDTGIALLFSIWRYHPTKEGSTETSKYIESADPKVVVLTEDQTKAPSLQDLLKAKNIVERLSKLSKNSSVLKVDYYSASSTSKRSSNVSISPVVTVAARELVALAQAGGDNRAAEIAEAIRAFSVALTYDQYMSIMLKAGKVEDHHSTIKMCLNACDKLFTSISAMED